MEARASSQAAIPSRITGIGEGEIQRLIGGLEGLSSSISELKQGLEQLRNPLVAVSEIEDPGILAKCWTKQVRKLCYDAGDYLYDVVHSGDEFKLLGSRALNATARHGRYDLHPEAASEAMARWLPAPHEDLIDHGDLVVEVAKLIGTDKELRVLSVVGPEGVGKTTLAKTLYHQAIGDDGSPPLECWAFIRASPKPDIRRLLTSMFRQIQHKRPSCRLNVHQLIDSIATYLWNKRYFIIIDDLWTAAVWEIIVRAFPDGDCGSRVIITTQIEGVALACCGRRSKYVFNMVPLSDVQSRNLFFGIVFGSESDCPGDLVEVSDGIIKKCGGLPLATINIVSMLPSALNLEQWTGLRDSLPSTWSANRTSEWMKEVVNLMFSTLRPHLKTCLLYFSMYPEGYIVGKDDLIKQWVVEGVVDGIVGQATEEEVVDYFDELVRRGMIQPVDTDKNGNVLSCTLHHIIHDVIVEKSMEENFVIIADYFQSAIPLPDKVRRLSVQFGGARSAYITDNIMVSEVRSLAFFGFLQCFLTASKFRHVRVLILHIWADEDKGCFDLTGIRELLRLRYLKVSCNIGVILPDEIQGQQYLETLEVHATVVAIPWDIGGLSRLSSLNIAVRELLSNDIILLQILPALTALSVHVKTAPTETTIVLDEGGFLNLKLFTFRCSAPRLLIEESALPKIEKLDLCFNAQEAHQECTRPITIEHLATLKEISVKIGGAVADADSALADAVTNHAKNPIPVVQLMESRGEKEHATLEEEDDIMEEDVHEYPPTQEEGSGVCGNTAQAQDRNENQDENKHADGRTSMLTGSSSRPSVPGWILPNIFTRLADKALSHMEPGESKDGISKLLTDIIPRLKLMVEETESGEDKLFNEKLVTELMTNFYELEEILDEVEYDRPERHLAYIGSPNQETQESSKILHVEPTVLVFVLDLLQPGKLIPCSLHLSNDTDQHMAFKLSTTPSVTSLDWSEHFMSRLPLYGIVPARSTYTLILTVVSEWKVATTRTCDMILQSCISPHNHITKFKCQTEREDYFEVHKAANAVHEVKLNAFLSEKGPSMSSEQTEPRVRILSMEKQSNTLYSVDAHPTNPWIISGHDFGQVRIWNHETKILLNSFKVSLGPVYSVKFIARKHWFICGSAEGLIHVYSYERKMQKITSFKAHDGLMYLAVHPTRPYVLSWPCSRYHQKKLWHWEKVWMCTQTFETEYFARDFVCHVAFDFKDTNRFASTSEHTLKVWSLDSPKPNYSLPKPFNIVNFLEFFTRDDQQYLITGSHDMTVTIWDMQMKKYVPKQLQNSVFPVASVFSHPNLPILLTCSSGGTSHFWSSKDFRLEAVLHYGYGGDVRSIACLMSSKGRCLYVIGQEAAITILDIANGKYQQDSMEEAPLYTETRQEKTNSEMISQGPNELLHIHPMKLHFPFQFNKVNLCSLHLTNKTDAHVAFRLSIEEGLEWWPHPFARMPLGGIVPSRSTYTLVVITKEMPYLVVQKRFNFILQSSISGDRYKYTFKDQSECDQFFEDAKETRNGVHELTLEADLSLQGLNGSTGEVLIQPSVNIWSLFHPAKDGCRMMYSLDADPTKSLILTGHHHGNVSLWQCGTQGSRRQGDICNTIVQKNMPSINVWEGENIPWNDLNTQLGVYSVKFITRKRWFVAGTYDGFIHVYNYQEWMPLIHKVKVHSSGIRENGIYSSRALVIHPTNPYVLSTFEEMKLLDWENNWECIRTFEIEHSDSVREVAFNPEVTNTFASASSDHTIKLWRLDSSTSEHTLHGHSDKVNCLEFFTCHGQQYLISGSEDCTAKIWDLKKRMCVHTVDVFMSPVISIIFLPVASYLITGSADGTIHLWSCASFRLERIFNIGCSGPVQSLCVMGSKRVVIQHEGQIYIMDTDTIPETSVPGLPNELVTVEPPELRFPVVQEVSIPLKISNITSHHVAFSMWSSPRNMENYSSLPPKGVLSPKSTLQVALTRCAHNLVQTDLVLKEAVFLRAMIVVDGFNTENVTYDMFEPMTGQIVHEVKLDVVLVASEIIRKVRLAWTLDVHPTKPWIMMTQGDYHVHIWNYDTRKAKSIAIKGREVTSAKFITLKQWIIVGCSTGFIYVYSHNAMLKNIEKIKVVRSNSKSVNSLAVHTIMPYVMSASQDGKILVWDYENDWHLMTTVHAKSLSKEHVEFSDYGNDRKLIKKIGGSSLSVEQVAFQTETDIFASAQGKTVKIWDLGSGKCKHILYGHSDLVLCLDYFSLGGKLHLITGSQDRTAKIWDCETHRCVKTLRGHMDAVKVACCHPDLQILITGSRDESIRLWDSKTFRHERTLQLDLGEVYAIASLKRSTRIAIANEKGLALVEIGLKEKKVDTVTTICSKNEKGLALVEIGLTENKDDTVTTMRWKEDKDPMIEEVST